VTESTEVPGDGRQRFILLTERLVTELAHERNHGRHLCICQRADKQQDNELQLKLRKLTTNHKINCQKC